MDYRSDYDVFFNLLDKALVVAEVKHGYPDKAVDAVYKLLSLARNGNAGFVNGVNIPSEVRAYVRFVYEGGDRPEFLRFYPEVTS